MTVSQMTVFKCYVYDYYQHMHTSLTNSIVRLYFEANRCTSISLVLYTPNFCQLKTVKSKELMLFIFEVQHCTVTVQKIGMTRIQITIFWGDTE